MLRFDPIRLSSCTDMCTPESESGQGLGCAALAVPSVQWQYGNVVDIDGGKLGLAHTQGISPDLLLSAV